MLKAQSRWVAEVQQVGKLWRNQSVAVLEGFALQIMMRMIPVVLYMLSQVSGA